MNLYLIGYRCTGKTSVGKLLAAELGYAFEDMDTRIAGEIGLGIADIVARDGWEFFRQREASLLQVIGARERQVVSTGGGVVLRPENRRRIRDSGLAVWLTARPDTILRRMRADRRSADSRPALTGESLKEEVRGTLAERLPLYAVVADFAVATDHFSPQEVCRAILEWMKGRR